MPEEFSTSMDQLVQLLKDRDSVKVSEAANLLDTNKSHIESWSNMLEKEGFVKVHYSVIGGAILQRGPNFNTILEKKSKEPEKAAVAEPAPKAQQTQKTQEEKQNTNEKQEEKASEPDKEVSPKNYLLIRKKIETGERYLEKDLEKLKEEQQKVIAYLTALIEDSNKLTQYIEDLHKLVGQTKESRKERKPEIAKS